MTMPAENHGVFELAIRKKDSEKLVAVSIPLEHCFLDEMEKRFREIVSNSLVVSFKLLPVDALMPPYLFDLVNEYPKLTALQFTPEMNSSGDPVRPLNPVLLAHCIDTRNRSTTR